MEGGSRSAAGHAVFVYGADALWDVLPPCISQRSDSMQNVDTVL